MENKEFSLKQLLTDLSFGIDEQEKAQVDESHSEALASEEEKSQEERLRTPTTAAFPEEVLKLIPDWIDFLVAASTFIYLFIALKRFYGQGWFLSYFKCSVATFAFMLIVTPIAAILIGLLSFMIY